MTAWANCKNILVIRADNMGDLLMSSPAINALKETFTSKIVLLTSKATEAVDLLPFIDEVVSVDLPWVKSDAESGASKINDLVLRLKQYKFDACVIFTVYSQSPLPAAMLAWMAGIPKRLAYCRENPYELINYWIPEKEPLELIKHQVERDLDLVERIGAVIQDKRIQIKIGQKKRETIKQKLISQKIDIKGMTLILHAGVSEEKRAFPETRWVELAKSLQNSLECQILFTGSIEERELTDRLQKQVGEASFSLGGEFTVSEYAALIAMVSLVISVNTATIHLAAALQTPQVVLYAQTNPQHHPWLAKCRIFEFSIPEENKSRNEIIRYVDKYHYTDYIPLPTTDEIVDAVKELLSQVP